MLHLQHFIWVYIVPCDIDAQRLDGCCRPSIFVSNEFVINIWSRLMQVLFTFYQQLFNRIYRHCALSVCLILLPHALLLTEAFGLKRLDDKKSVQPYSRLNKCQILHSVNIAV